MRLHSSLFRNELVGSAPLGVAALACLAACSSSSTTTPTSDAGNPSDTAVSLSVAPSTANVLTCDSIQLSESGGVGNGTWSVSPAGTGSIGAKGLYSAPTIAPSNPAVTITYAEPPQSASASIQVATAFLGTPTALPIAANQPVENVPFDHQFSANGKQIYAGLVNPDSLHADVFASSDGGKTFALAGSYHSGDTECVTVAVDAGNPQVVYLVYQAGHGDSTSNTGGTVRLAVSSDGAKTFPTEYVIADSTNAISNMICPDVISPSPGHVIVIGADQDGGVSGSPAWVGAWVSASQGANIGPVGTPLTCTKCPADGSTYYASSDTNSGSSQTKYFIAVNGDGYAPRLGTNGNGKVCMVYQYDGGDQPNLTEVQCSADNGQTWTPPTFLGAPDADTKIHPTVAVSPNGTVAVAWVDTVASAIQAFVAFSTDGGKTFGTPIQYPALPDSLVASGNNFGVDDPVVAWESDDILWISESVNVGNTETIFVDKTCDLGKTWSGAVQVAQLNGSSLVSTSAGFVVGAYTSSPPTLSTIALDAQ